ncbi:MAG: Response regulator receiver domain [Pseudomonadota bacterium]
MVERDPATLVERVGRVQPDAVVLQADMARFDGLDLARQLRSLRACVAIPLLAVLSDPQDAAFHRAARSLVDGTLVRPFTAATAQTTVMAALHRVEIARELGGRDPVTGLYTRRTTLAFHRPTLSAPSPSPSAASTPAPSPLTAASLVASFVALQPNRAAHSSHATVVLRIAPSASARGLPRPAPKD